MVGHGEAFVSVAFSALWAFVGGKFSSWVPRTQTQVKPLRNKTPPVAPQPSFVVSFPSGHQRGRTGRIRTVDRPPHAKDIGQPLAVWSSKSTCLGTLLGDEATLLWFMFV